MSVYDGWTLDTPGNADAFDQGSAGFARPASQGWNMVEVLDANAADVNANSAIVARYTWGLDLSGLGGAAGTSGIHGAGGIGGLLAAVEGGTTGSPVHCRSNGLRRTHSDRLEELLLLRKRVVVGFLSDDGYSRQKSGDPAVFLLSLCRGGG